MDIQYRNGTSRNLIPYPVEDLTMLVSTLKEKLKDFLPDGNIVDELIFENEVLNDMATVESYNIPPNANITGVKSIYIPVHVDINDKGKTLTFNTSILENGHSFLEKVKNSLAPYNITNFNLSSLGNYLRPNETFLQQGITDGTHFRLVPEVIGGLSNAIN